MIVETPLPHATATEPSRPNDPPEGAVDPPHDVADRRRTGESHQDVVVIRHHHVAMKRDIPAAPAFGPDIDERAGEVRIVEEPTPLVETTRQCIGALRKIDAWQPAMAHSDGLLLWAGDTLLPYGERGTAWAEDTLLPYGERSTAWRAAQPPRGGLEGAAERPLVINVFGRVNAFRRGRDTLAGRFPRLATFARHYYAGHLVVAVLRPCGRTPENLSVGFDGVGSDDAGVPVGGALGGALQGVVVHPDDAEPLIIAFRPFEVVQQGPEEVALDGNARGDGGVEFEQMGFHEAATLLVFHAPGGIRLVLECRTSHRSTT